MRQIWQHRTSGERYVVEIDEAGEVKNAAGPLRHTELASSWIDGFDGDADVADDLQSDSPSYMLVEGGVMDRDFDQAAERAGLMSRARNFDLAGRSDSEIMEIAGGAWAARGEAFRLAGLNEAWDRGLLPRPEDPGGEADGDD